MAHPLASQIALNSKDVAAYGRQIAPDDCSRYEEGNCAHAQHR